LKNFKEKFNIINDIEKEVRKAKISPIVSPNKNPEPDVT